MAIYGNVVGSSKKIPVNNNGTVYSTNADYAEIGQWADGNPNNEDRIGYFVAVDMASEGTTMVKATSTADVRGVTVTKPAFAGGHSDDKVDTNGELKSAYDYVAVMGLVPVIDNGTCTVNSRCMPTDDGTAVPSTNNMGYQVIERVDDTHVLIAVEPGADMIKRIKDDIDTINDNLDDINDTENGILKQAKDYADTNDSAIEGKIGTVADGTTVVGMISAMDTAYKAADTALSGRVKTIEDDYLKAVDKTELSNAIGAEKTRAEGIEGGLRTDVNAVSGKVTTLIGSDASKSARTIASEEVAKIVAGADASYDTLKEIADWISSHKTDATAMNSAIVKLEAIVKGIGGTDEKATVVTYVTDAIDALKIGDYAKASDLTALAARVKAIEDKNISTGANKVEKSTTNGNIKIDGTETTVYTHPGSGTNPHGTTASDVGLGNVGNFKAVSTVANQGLTETEKANARANIGASSFSGSYNDLTNKPTIPDTYVLPTGSATVKGGFKVGSGLTVTGDVLSATGGGTADSVDWNNVQNKPTEFTPTQHTHTASEVGALPSSTVIPSKTSQLTNDSGFITGYTETDPTVPAWAKADTKPTYTASEVGLGNVDNVKQYSASNPPPYPVTSVNGQTGDITVDGMDVIELTYDEYQAIENKDSGTMYIVTDKSLSSSGEGESGSYAKEQILSDETKGLYGLKTSAVPDNVFSKISEKLDTKQDAIIGTERQIVGFDENGNPVAQDAPDTGVRLVKLWQNASPGSEFANQVVSIPKMNEYAFICIKYASDTNQAEYIWSVIADCSHNGMITAHMHSLKYRSAIIKPNINAIHFYNCTFSTTDENYKSNAYMIPLEVYGVKGIAI